MATYTPTGNPDIINKAYSATTTVNIRDFIDRYQQIKQDYLNAIDNAKADGQKLLDDLQPIYVAGLLPSGFTTQYNQLVAFVS